MTDVMPANGGNGHAGDDPILAKGAVEAPAPSAVSCPPSTAVVLTPEQMNRLKAAKNYARLVTNMFKENPAFSRPPSATDNGTAHSEPAERDASRRSADTHGHDRRSEKDKRRSREGDRDRGHEQDRAHDRERDRHRDRDLEHSKRRSRSRSRSPSRAPSHTSAARSIDRQPPPRSPRRAPSHDGRRSRSPRADSRSGRRRGARSPRSRSRSRDSYSRRHRRRSRDRSRERSRDRYRDYHRDDRNRDRDREYDRRRAPERDRPHSAVGAGAADRKPAALVTPVINRTINRIYVGNIASTVTEAAIRTLFSKFGYIKELSMTRDPELNTHKGWCFVEYDAPEAAETAIRIMNGSALAERPLRCNHTNAYTDDIWRHFAPKVTSRLYIANVHPYVDEEDMRQLFSPFGKLQQFSLCPDVNSFKHKTYGFAEYEEEPQALAALRHLDNMDIGGERLLVARTLVGGPFPEGMSALSRFPPPRHLPHVPSGSKPRIPKVVPEDPSPVLLLRNMVEPADVDEYLKEDVEEECSRHGTIKSVEVHVDSGLINESDSGVRVFVEFASVSEREACVKVMDGRFFGGRKVSAAEYSLDKFQNKDFSG